MGEGGAKNLGIKIGGHLVEDEDLDLGRIQKLIEFPPILRLPAAATKTRQKLA